MKKIWWRRLYYYICICECWKERIVSCYDIHSWHTKSCWCLFSKDIRLSNLWMCWRALKHRCDNNKSQSYINYWGRGIKCEWNSFDEFYNDMFPSWKKWLELDRIDNNWNYCKANCRWATSKENNNNRRNTIYYKWESLSLVCERLNLNKSSINSRLFKWWNINDAIEIPINFKKWNK
jgi:hypothetical protein